MLQWRPFFLCGIRNSSSHMRDYFIRRALLIIPTLLGITMLVFMVTRFVPGGPLERAIMEAQQASVSRSSRRRAGQGMALSDEQLQQLKEYYGFDKPWYESYVLVGWQGRCGAIWDESTATTSRSGTVISQRFPIVLFYRLVTLVITYSVCIPLGVVKAIGHQHHGQRDLGAVSSPAMPCPATCWVRCCCFSSRCDWTGFPWGASPASTSMN